MIAKMNTGLSNINGVPYEREKPSGLISAFPTVRSADGPIVTALMNDARERASVINWRLSMRGKWFEGRGMCNQFYAREPRVFIAEMTRGKL